MMRAPYSIINARARSLNHQMLSRLPYGGNIASFHLPFKDGRSKNLVGNTVLYEISSHSKRPENHAVSGHENLGCNEGM